MSGPRDAHCGSVPTKKGATRAPVSRVADRIAKRLSRHHDVPASIESGEILDTGNFAPFAKEFSENRPPARMDENHDVMAGL